MPLTLEQKKTVVAHISKVSVTCPNCSHTRHAIHENFVGVPAIDMDGDVLTQRNSGQALIMLTCDACFSVRFLNATMMFPSG